VVEKHPNTTFQLEIFLKFQIVYPLAPPPSIERIKCSPDSGNTMALYISHNIYLFRSPNYPIKVTELVQISAESVRIALFPDETALHLHFPANQRLNDGNWNNLVITWTSHGGAYSLVWNAVRLYADRGYGKKKHLDINAWISLGHPLEAPATDPKFTGSVTRINMWTRVLDFEHDIPTIVQKCQNSQVHKKFLF
jgi:hypothetical protein